MTPILLSLLACRAPLLVDPPPPELMELGQPADRGNLLAIQAWVDPTVYAEADRLDDRLRSWLDRADQEGWIRADTVVVLPESIGTWLFLVDESARVIEASDSELALERLVRHHPAAFLRARGQAPWGDTFRYALYAFKADETAAAYQDVMAGIAADYRVTLVAGTLILPGPAVDGGDIVPFPGEPLRDVAFVFGPDGRVMSPPIAEVHPDASELGAVLPGFTADLPVLDSPLGPLGVLPGEDAWFPESFEAVQGGAELPWIVAPQHVSPAASWASPWLGYVGWPTPSDVDPQDLRGLSLAQADASYGLPGRTRAGGFPGGVAVPLRGALWELGTDGVVRLGLGEDWVEGPEGDQPVIANLWLPDREAESH